MSTAPTAPEKYLVAFVIQGDTMFKITADNIIQATGGAAGLASFDGVAKLKAAAALVELTNQHNERPEELRQMAREMAGEGIELEDRNFTIEYDSNIPQRLGMGGSSAIITGSWGGVIAIL